LGTGTLAAYGREGDHIRFYEINPDVVRVAEGEGGYFSYINDSQAFIEIILGDARLSLEREWAQNGSQNYDLILVDTFSSDSIPVHLITREAFNLYFRHLKTDGILAIHISNNHLDLEPVVLSMAENFSMRSALVASGKTREGSSAAVWILLTLNETFLDADDIRFLEVDPAARDRTIRLWTDDYSNLFQILR
jgi:spermidine synthase